MQSSNQLQAPGLPDGDLVDLAALQARNSVQERRLQTAIEIATILARERELDKMLSQFLSCLTETLQAAEYGILFLYDTETHRLKVRAAQRYQPEWMRRIRLAPGEGTCGKAFQSGQPELFPDEASIAAARENLTEANREFLEAAMAGQPRAQSCISIPLATAETNIGVLSMENLRRPGSFAQEDLPFLRAIAGLIALSIENALLREDLQVTDALREANRLKAELISTLAHEMRTPLTSVKGYSTALLMEEATFDPETQREFLQFIDEECDVLQALIHDLLESSIIDAGLLRLEPQPVNLPRLTKNVIDDMARRTKIHRFLLDYPESFPILDADPDRIVQVLRNLLDNAVKYSPEGGLIVVRGEVREHEAVMSVADQGVGLTPEHVNRLFEKYFRAKSLLGRHVVGSGLGLPISRTIVESHGGRIWAESKVGEGTTLYFALPLEGPSHEAIEREER